MSKVFKNYMKESRENYGQYVDNEDDNLCVEQLQLGAILRIADATELMAKNHEELAEDRDKYKRFWKTEEENCRLLRKRIAGLQGYIKRLRKLPQKKSKKSAKRVKR